MRLAHFSDIHLTLSPFAMPARELALKRAASAFSYYFSGRRWRFAHAKERIAALLADIDAQAPDHVLCTGDLTASSLEEELAGVAALFGQRSPERFTVIPGNHDRYVRQAGGAFERYFGARTYPFMKKLGGVALIGIDVTRPTGLTNSSGLCGEAQRAALREALAGARGHFVILALHYGLLRQGGERDKRKHGLRDDLALLALIDDPTLPLDLVLHGHMHMPYAVRSARRQIICAGSATDLKQKCGYNIYEIDVASRRMRCERRRYTPEGFVVESVTDFSGAVPKT
jgi:3',5'-cyclic AMP phosphodiesterase CpdA